MTSVSEQEMFRRLAYQQSRYGAIVELGAWLGACTYALASGVKERDVANVVHSYDRFKWDPRTHPRKAGMDITDLYRAYKQNIAPLAQYVHPHKGEILFASWDGGVISLLVCDAPKRFKVVQHALSEFGCWLRKGSVMAWQDFCFPPAYAIPASLYRLRAHHAYRDSVDFTVVLEVVSPWRKEDVQEIELDWTLAEVSAAVDYWRGVLPDAAYAGVACGLALFLIDLGHVQAATTLASQSNVGPLRRIRQTHPGLVKRYASLFRVLP